MTNKNLNPFNVQVGQVWRDLDVRSTYPEFTILDIAGDKAVTKRGPRHASIRLDRFKHAGGRGYELVRDLKTETDPYQYYDTTTLYLNGETLDEVFDEVKQYPAELLAKIALNERLNNFISEWILRKGDIQETRIYIGWYWRNTDLVSGRISIGRAGRLIGVMENNKWDYPERVLTPEEAEKFRNIVWDAYKVSRAGGVLSEIHASVDSVMTQLYLLLQTFEVE